MRKKTDVQNSRDENDNNKSLLGLRIDVLEQAVLEIQNGRRWKEHLNSYLPYELTELKFTSEKHAKLGIEMLWLDLLKGCPHRIVGNCGFVIPANAVLYFRKAGMNFKELRLES